MLMNSMYSSQARHQPGMTYIFRNASYLGSPGNSGFGGVQATSSGTQMRELTLKLTEMLQCREIGISADFDICPMNSVRN